MSLKKIKIPSDLKGKARFKGLKVLYEGKIGKTNYFVFYSKIGEYTHLRIHRKDNKPICNWCDMQEIKNLLIGVDKTAIQIFPTARNLVDNGNTYHLWHYNDMKMPNLKELYDYTIE